MKTQRGFGVVEIIIVVVILVGVGVGVWYVWHAQRPPANTTPPPQSTQNIEPSLPQATTKKYTNTKYGYSFEYPVEAEIHSDIPFGGQSTPVTPESDSVTVELPSKKFEVGFTGYNTPTVERVYQNFSGTVRPEDIVVTKVNVGNAIGLKVTFKDPALTGSYYFLQKKAESPVAMISMSAGLEDIVNSFIFE